MLCYQPWHNYLNIQSVLNIEDFKLSFELFLCRDISWVWRTHEISLHKNNSPGFPDKDTPLTGSCYILYVYYVSSVYILVTLYKSTPTYLGLLLVDMHVDYRLKKIILVILIPQKSGFESFSFLIKKKIN